jgi:hypothetical protein
MADIQLRLPPQDIPDEVDNRERRVVALTAEHPQVEDVNELEREFLFDGAMILDDDAISIGLNNYADLQNLRYTNKGLEGVQGYSQINTTAITTYTALRSGIQFVKRVNGKSVSHILVQSYNAGLTASQVFQNTAGDADNDSDVPAQRDFDGTALHVDSSNALLGRFALGPDGTVVYCNGEEAYIWGSDEHRVAGVINFDDVGTTFSYDFTERLSNTFTGASNLATLVRRDTTNEIYLYIGSTRPLQGIKFYVNTANTSVSTSTVEYWASGGWSAVGGFSDGTASGGITLAQTGTMSFTSTASVADPTIIDERYLYWYRVIAGATGTPDATIVLEHITVDAPFQSMVDIWDGTERNPIAFHIEQVNNGKLLDFTLEVQSPSFSASPIAANMTLVRTANNDVWYVGFEERMTAIRYRMVADFPNDDASSLTVDYWNGTAWVAVSDLVDGTSNGGNSLGSSGLVTWTAPAVTSEFDQELFGFRGYFYRHSLDDQGFSEEPDVLLDVVTGIPAPKYTKDNSINGYKFPLTYRGRVLLCGRPLSNEGNRIDYTAIGSPDVHNGFDSSDQGKSMFVGDHEDLTAGIELFNRFGDIITLQAVITKARQTWILIGSRPGDFQLFPVSETVGCPCPLTMDRADVSFSVDTSAVRNIALWVSYKGPMMFDGGVLSPMRFEQSDGSVSSIDPYFDPNDSRYVTVSALEHARGWFDPTYSEYNILLPTGAAAGNDLADVWLCCDLQRRKWFRKVPATNYPQMGFRVVDNTGGQYVYAGIDTGRMMRLENSNAWDGTNIVHTLQTSDMLLTGSIWDETLLRYVRATILTESGDADSVSLTHAANGSGSFSAIASLTLLSSGSDRYRRVTDALNLRGWTHQFEISVTTDDKARAPRLTSWGLKFRTVRDQGFDSTDNLIGQGLTGPTATP